MACILSQVLAAPRSWSSAPGGLDCLAGSCFAQKSFKAMYSQSIVHVRYTVCIVTENIPVLSIFQHTLYCKNIALPVTYSLSRVYLLCHAEHGCSCVHKYCVNMANGYQSTLCLVCRQCQIGISSLGAEFWCMLDPLESGPGSYK